MKDIRSNIPSSVTESPDSVPSECRLLKNRCLPRSTPKKTITGAPSHRINNSVDLSRPFSSSHVYSFPSPAVSLTPTSSIYEISYCFAKHPTFSKPRSCGGIFLLNPRMGQFLVAFPTMFTFGGFTPSKQVPEIKLHLRPRLKGMKYSVSICRKTRTSYFSQYSPIKSISSTADLS